MANRVRLFLTFLSSFLFSISLFSQGGKVYSVNKRLYFPNNEYLLDTLDIKILDSLRKIPNIKTVKVYGHCDSIGSFDFNLTLSTKRSNQVKEYLAQFIEENIIEIFPEGESKLKTHGDDSVSLAQNRRVEIQITYQPSIQTVVNKNKKLPNVNDSISVVLNGFVTDDINRPLQTTINIYDEKGKFVKKSESDKNGLYSVLLKIKKSSDYSILFAKDSFFTASEKINLKVKNDLPIKQKTVLQRIVSGKTYIFDNLHFEGDTSQLLGYSEPLLYHFLQIMKRYPNIKIQIEGHVNNPIRDRKILNGPPRSLRYFPPGLTFREYNQWLSDERALAVKSFLVKNGIKKERISTLGYGASKMLYPDPKSEKEQELNRRVEIKIL
ncbi:MAG: OmpA family protein [Saprospiraceae bacterium]|nr:OmpA family protein [Saprospiraceae bacterium]